MRFESVISAKLAALEIEYFLDDPDDNPDRFGDGHYYRQPGEEEWSGPWEGPEECLEMYREHLEYYYASLERKLAIYEKPPRAGARRFVVRFNGILHPAAIDVRFFLWIVGPGRPAPMMTAVIDAPSPEDIPALFAGTVLTYGDLDASETTAVIDDIRRDLDLLDPVSGP